MGEKPVSERLAVVEYQVSELALSVDDHEDRIKAIELMAAKVGVWAFVGSMLGGAVAYAVASRLLG